MPFLSKSTFIKGNQCAKAFYLNKFHKELKDEADVATSSTFERGINIGKLAQQLFPKGEDASPENYYEFEKSVSNTIKLLQDKTKAIYEAGFLFDEVYVALDILVKETSGYTAYEVKSSTDVSDTYILDAALQYYVITNSGIKIKDFYIVHINNEYVKMGSLNVKKLFAQKSIFKEVKELQPYVVKKISELKSVLKMKQIPHADIGPHCSDPYPCDFSGHCWKHIPDYSVFDIANLRSNKKFELYYNGHIKLNKIPKDYSLNEKQWEQINCELKQKNIIQKDKIKDFINELKYPLYHLDFETFQLAIPVYDNSRPYQQMVFQYSLHKQVSKNGKEEHFEFLAETNGLDPRIPFIEKLIKDCGIKGDILVYNIGFERSRLNELAIDFPKYKKNIQNIVDRLKDLMIPFRERWYYMPEMRGSYSIKQVLPALVPKLSYKNLEISNGGMASETFSAMVHGTFHGDITKARKALLEYCKLDTYAMVKILEKLQKV